MPADSSRRDNLWQQYLTTQSRDTRNKLLEEYSFLCKCTANSLFALFAKHIEYDDLLSMAMLGLMRAIEKFDPERGVKFESYAFAVIRGTVIDDVRRADWVPRSLRDKAQSTGKPISRVISLEEFLQKNNESELRTPSETRNESPELYAEWQEVRLALGKAVDKLSSNERAIILLRYFKGLTYKKIGNALNISDSRVSQLHSQAILKLKTALSA